MLKTLLSAAEIDVIADNQNIELVRTWLENKKVKNSDLAFTTILKTPEQWNWAYKGLLEIANFKLSYSEGVKYFEIICDLIMMGKSQEIFLKSAIDDNTLAQQNWKNHLLKIRYPESYQSDENLKAKFEKLPWPYGSKIKFERRGDRAGVEFKMFITSQTDLIKALSALERVKENL